MTSTTSRLRRRLDTLWKTIRDENIVSDQVSDDFLSTCKIKLVQQVFHTTNQSLYLNQSPPVLFAPLPTVAITEHPFDDVRCKDPFTNGSLRDFIDYGAPDHVPAHLQNATKHPRYLSGYLEKWTFSGFPRKRLPPLVYGLAGLSFLVPIRLHGEIYSQPGIFGEKHGNQHRNLWGASMWEYWKDNERTYHPHIIMLSHHSASGRNSEIYTEN